MGIYLKSKTLMELDDAPVFLAVWGVAMLFIASGVFIALAGNLFGSLFVLLGGFALAAVNHNKVVLDKRTGRLKANVFSIAGSRNFDCSLSKVRSVSFAQFGAARTGIQYNILFALSDGTLLSYPNITRHMVDVKKIASFLGVPFKPQRHANMVKKV